MGCLFELIFEVIFEFFIDCYIKLMQLIIPDNIMSERTKEIIKNTVTTIALLLVVVLITGIVLILPDDPSIKIIGKYMTYIPLTIIVLQIILGITVRIVSRSKKWNYTAFSLPFAQKITLAFARVIFLCFFIKNDVKRLLNTWQTADYVLLLSQMRQ